MLVLFIWLLVLRIENPFCSFPSTVLKCQLYISDQLNSELNDLYEGEHTSTEDQSKRASRIADQIEYTVSSKRLDAGVG